MIPEKIKALFEFIDYLDLNKKEYIEKYIPLCVELGNLRLQLSNLQPQSNHTEKLHFDRLQEEVTDKFLLIKQDILLPISNKLQELKIWSGDDSYISIWNGNISTIHQFKKSFELNDISEVLTQKKKYIDFRNETNSDFHCLYFILRNLDELLIELFSFFKDTNENEFENFERKTMEVNTLDEALKNFQDNKGKNISYSILNPSLFDYHNVKQYFPQPPTVINETIMGNKIQVGNISNNSGQIVIGQDIKLSDMPGKNNELVNQIAELIKLIRLDKNADDEQKQILITNFDKIKEELHENQPSKGNIYKWIFKTKTVLDTLIFSYDVTQAAEWIYKSFGFISK